MERRWQTAAFTELGIGDLYEILRLRQAVFAVEQQSIYLDLDGKDQLAEHMMCWEGEELAAYQRMLAPGLVYPESAIGRIVVAARARGAGLGRELVRRGIAHNLQRWPERDIRINAQSYLEKFYCDLGFTVDGEPYDLDSIPHVEMLYRRR